jgi:hypothetical protein
MKEDSSLILTTTRFSMFLQTEIPKDKKFMSGRDTVEQTRDGELSMLTKLPR